MLKFLVRHQFFYFAGHSLNVVDNQFIKIGVLVSVVDDELAADGLPSGVCIRLNNVCD